MRKPTLDCPYASYTAEMRVFCSKAKGLCGNQYFKTCKGWWTLTEAAADCPVKEKKSNARKQASKK